MPTTTDLPTLLRGSIIALGVWFGGMAAAAVLVEPSTVVVFGPVDKLSQAIDRGGASILSFGRGYVVAKGSAQSLYANGAWFVWPSLARPCGSNKR